jgi:hypothetical protein
MKGVGWWVGGVGLWYGSLYRANMEKETMPSSEASWVHVLGRMALLRKWRTVEIPQNPV